VHLLSAVYLGSKYNLLAHSEYSVVRYTLCTV